MSANRTVHLAGRHRTAAATRPHQGIVISVIVGVFPPSMR